MRIDKITSINKQNFSNKTFNKSKTKTASYPVISELSTVNSAYYNINFTGLFEESGRKKFLEAQEEFTPAANKIWNKTKYIANKYGDGNVTEEHLLAAILSELIKYIDRLNSGSIEYQENARQYLPYTFEEKIGVINLLKDEKLRNIAKEILEKYLRQTMQEIMQSNTHKIQRNKFKKTNVDDKLIAALNSAYQTMQEIKNSDNFTDDIFLVAILGFLDNDKIKQRFKNLQFETQKATLVEDISTKDKNHLQFYDTLADKLWKNLDLGNDVYVTFESENTQAYEHLVSSFVNLIHKSGQKYTNLNAQNTEIVVFKPNAIFETLGEYVKQAKKDPSKTYIFILNFSEILKANTYVEQRREIYLNSDEQKLIKNEDASNVRIILVSNKDTYYANTASDAALKKSLEHYGMIPIPMIDANGAKEILTSDRGIKYVKTKTNKVFTPEAISLAIGITDEADGYYPEKAINYLSKVASYYVDKGEINAENIQVYENELNSIQQKSSNGEQNEFRITFDTEKTLDDIIGSPMTKAEAKSIVEQIKMAKKGYVKGFTTFLDNGSSYGGGRRHTAQCIAGEAKIPMITINARDFALKDIDALSANSNLSELKIKKLISTAKAQAQANKNNTAMIFIENFDNFGSNPLFGISSIYEQKAFSQLLEEMENLRKKSDVNIIIVGSTNYPETLDENIMKPHKFLNKIIIYSPQDTKDREDIIRYYISKNGLKVGNTSEEEDKIIKNAAETTMYFSVVDIIYLLEKADTISRERGKTIIDKSDMTEAYLQTTTGRVSTMQKNEHENELVAKHECGHALTLQIMYEIAKKENKPWHLPDKVNFITLDPRGTYGGAMYPKNSENSEYSFEKIFSEIICDFGGYSSEKYFFNMEGSWGITQDMSMATNMAKLAVQKMGMGAKTGRVSIGSEYGSSSFMSVNLKNRISYDIETILRNAENISNKIISAYSDFVEQFGQKYKSKVGTGECIITSEEFQQDLAAWREKQSPEKKKELLDLENEILQIIEKTKQGEIVKQ